MASAQNRPASGTIAPDEVAGFNAIASEWWDERGKFAPLHRINPVRIGYIRDQALAHFARAGETATPLKELAALDIGCGGGPHRRAAGPPRRHRHRHRRRPRGHRRGESPCRSAGPRPSITASPPPRI